MPKYNSLQAPFAAKRVDHAATGGKPFRGQAWRMVQLNRETLPPQTWKVKAGQVHLGFDGTGLSPASVTRMAFYDFPAEHWGHLRTSNPIESTFATVRLRTYRTKGPGGDENSHTHT